MKSVTLSILLGLLISSVAHSSTTTSVTTDEIVQDSQHNSFSISDNNNCKIHNPFPRENESVQWSGDCHDGYAQGPGIVTWYQYDERYAKETGYMNKGRLDGYVVTQFLDGNTLIGMYQGEIDNGFRQGYGIYTYSDGSSYAGQFKNNEQNGFGKLSLSPQLHDLIEYWQSQDIGDYVGKYYVIEGIFNNGELITECQIQDCPED